MTKKITVENYQEEAMAYILPSCENGTYSTAGMIGEIGEVASLIAKAKRKEVDIDLTKAKKELGDCMWFLALYAHLCGKNFSDFIDEKGDFKIKFTVKIEDNAGVQDACSFNLSEFKDSNELDLVECLQMNIDKLADRKARGVIIGDGDNR